MTNCRKIFFRADAGPEIGYGHFIRTLALADMLKEDFDCTFFTQTPTEYQKKEAASVCPLVELPADDSRFDLFLDKLTGNEIVVLDNYFYTTDYQRKIKEKGCKLVCLDGMTTKHYVADIVINQSCSASRNDFSLEVYTQLKLGLQYALLRKPFIAMASCHKRSVFCPFHALVCFGGADKYNLTDKVVNTLCSCEKVQSIIAVIGDAYSIQHQRFGKVEYKRNLSAEKMADLLRTVDVAILPSSTVLKEALACKTFVIGGYFADNQIQTYEAYSTKNLISGVGNYCASDSMNRLLRVIETESFKKSSPDLSGIDGEIPQRYINMFKVLSGCS